MKDLNPTQLQSAVMVALDASHIGEFINQVSEPHAAYHILAGACLANVLLKIEDEQWAKIKVEFLLPCTHENCECYPVREKLFIGIDALRTQGKTIMTKMKGTKIKGVEVPPSDPSRN